MTKNQERIRYFKETGNSRYGKQNKIDKDLKFLPKIFVFDGNQIVLKSNLSLFEGGSPSFHTAKSKAINFYLIYRLDDCKSNPSNNFVIKNCSVEQLK